MRGGQNVETGFCAPFTDESVRQPATDIEEQKPYPFDICLDKFDQSG
jgi:hypothetical protein